jgi:hypothetical protein
MCRILALLLGFGGVVFPLPVLADALPDCAGPVEISNAAIIRVERNGDLVLKDGRTAVLEGLRLPLHDGGPPALAEEMLRSLREVAGTPLTFTASMPKEDRYRRLRVQAFGAAWLQTELLRRGLARVAIAADRQECAAELYKAEDEARGAKKGLWSFSVFTMRKPEAISVSDNGTFQIVEGRLVNAARHDGRIFLDFSDDYRHGLSAVVAPDDTRFFRRMKFDNLSGHIIRLRGVVQDYEGKPEMALSNPAEIELIQ